MNRRDFLRLIPLSLAPIPVVGKMFPTHSELEVNGEPVAFSRMVADITSQEIHIRLSTSYPLSLNMKLHDVISFRYKGFSGEYMIKGWEVKYSGYTYRLQDVESAVSAQRIEV